MDGAGTLFGGSKGGIDGHMQFADGTGGAHLVDMGPAEGSSRHHVHEVGQQRIGMSEIGDTHGDRPQAPDLVLGRHRTFAPGMNLARIISDEGQALAFRILEGQRQPASLFGDRIVLHAQFRKAGFPVIQGIVIGHTEASAADRMGAAMFGANGPVEEGDIGTGRAGAIGVEQVIGRGVVLVDGFLDQAETKGLRIEIVVAGRAGGDGGQVVKAFEVHGENSSTPDRGGVRVGSGCLGQPSYRAFDADFNRN